MSKNSRPYSPNPNYAVGYGRPPVSSRFQSGTSGNPRGRPRRKERSQGAGSHGELSMLHQAVLEAGATMVEVKRGERRVKVSAHAAVIGGLIGSARQGNTRAADMFLRFHQEAEEMERLRSVHAGQGIEFTRKIVRLLRTEGAAARENEQLRARIAELEGAGPSHVEVPQLTEEAEVDIDPPSGFALPAAPQQGSEPLAHSAPKVDRVAPVTHTNAVAFPTAPRRLGDPLIPAKSIILKDGFGN